MTTTDLFDAAEQISTLTTMNGSSLVKKLTYTFDLNGNRTQQTDQNNVSTTFSYDQANRMTRYGSNSTYAYDGDGLRTSKTVSGVKEAFTWNLAEAPSAPLVDGTTNYVTGFGGLPLEQISSKTVYYYHQDQLGSTRAMTDSRGGVVNTYDYDSYGKVTASSGTVSNPLQYGGQYLDSESGLQYLRARYYDAASELLLTKDQVVQVGGASYAYAAGSPLNATDQSGFAPDWHAGWNALVGGSREIGRQALTMGLTAAGDWVGQEHDDLASGDPHRFARGVIGVGLVVGSVIPGVAEADAVALEARGGVYLLRDAEGVVVRTGRTNNLARRELEHARDPLTSDLTFEPVYRTDVYGEQRGLEQVLYNRYPGARLNKIRPISLSNPNFGQYTNLAMRFLERQ
jgi:RHS repeat-associated protein